MEQTDIKNYENAGTTHSGETVKIAEVKKKKDEKLKGITKVTKDFNAFIVCWLIINRRYSVVDSPYLFIFLLLSAKPPINSAI